MGEDAKPYSITDRMSSVIKGHPCRFFYDYDSLALLFQEAGFSVVERKAYLDSKLEHIELIDNRPEQLFYLEAIK